MRIVTWILFTVGAAALLFTFEPTKHISVLWRSASGGLNAGLTSAGRVYCFGAIATLAAEVFAVVAARRANEKLIKSEAFHICSILDLGYIVVLFLGRQ